MKKLTKQIKCPKCKARYWLKDSFERHMEKAHPFKEFIRYMELLDSPNQWGVTYNVEKDAKEFKKSPFDFALHMAYLSQIWHTLNKILEELKREKVLK